MAEPYGLIACVGDVVPSPGGHEDAPSVTDVLFDGQFVLRWAHPGLAVASVETEELIGVCVHL